jgi:methylenetetrahydrofolate reductase (NADPH)
LKTLKDALRSPAFTLTAELAVTPELNAAKIVDQAKLLSTCVDAIQIPDHQQARPHMSNLAIAVHLLQNDIDPVVHMNSRDRNRIAIQSDLLGAQSLGITNLLLMRGRQLSADHQPEAKGVYDIDGIGLITSAVAVRDGTVLSGGSLPGEPEFFIGTVARVLKSVEDWHPEKLFSKTDAGAQFIQLQICMNMKSLQDYMSRLISTKLTWRCQVLAQLAVFASADEVKATRKIISDAIVPQSIVRRLKGAKNPEQEGIRICAEQLQQVTEIPGIAGATIMTPGDPANIVAAIEASGVRTEPTAQVKGD